ncbi:MAG: glycosyltransferase family 2 protein [Flavihumibacter sp.]
MAAYSYPLISIITLNYNNAEVTRDFLRSLKRDLTYPNTEVIVIDNASKMSPAEMVAAEYPGAVFIQNNSNQGFAAGNNAGIHVAKGDYFFIVNNDTEVTPNLLESLLDVFRQYPEAGVVCPKFHYFFHKGVIEYAGYNKVNILTGRNGMVGAQEEDKGQYDQLTETHYAHGGAMLVSRAVIEKVGPMVEDYFLYYEELDWSERIKKAGFKIYYQPAALIYHKESMSTGKESPLKTYYLTRNRILFMRRFMPGAAFLVFAGYFSLFTIPKNTLRYCMARQSTHLASFWRGILWHFNNRFTYKAAPAG